MCRALSAGLSILPTGFFGNDSTRWRQRRPLLLVMGLGVSLALVYVRRGWDPLVFRIWPAILLIYVELMIVTGVALLFSSFSSPALSALLTFFVFVIGHFGADLKTLANSAGSAPARIGFHR